MIAIQGDSGAPIPSLTGVPILIIVFAGLVGGILWNLATWLFGLPSSSSHALFGGLIGAAIAALGWGGVKWSGVITSIALPAIFAPVVAALVSATGTRLVYAITHRLSTDSTDAIPTWVKIVCAVAIALGTYFGGWRVIRTLGKGLVEVESPQGMAAEAASAAAILTSSHLGMALSTTHVATGSILGTGIGKKGASVRWGVAGRMVVAWLITLPAAGFVGALSWGVAHGLGPVAGTVVMLVVLIGGSASMFRRSRKNMINATNVNSAWRDGLIPADDTVVAPAAGTPARV